MITLNEKHLLPELPGVYFVKDGDLVLYVGKTKNLNIRWLNHHRYDQLCEQYPNAVISWIIVTPELLHITEKEFIQKLNPLLNSSAVLYKPRMSKKVKQVTIRVQITLPIQIAIPLSFLCYFMGKSLPNWTRDIIVEEIKANIDDIKKELRDSAELQNMDVETLKKEILEMYDIQIEDQ